MAILKAKESYCVLLLSLVFSLGQSTTNQGLKKPDKHCIHIVSINVPSDDSAQSTNNYAFKANVKEAFLSKNPGLFRIKHGGFLGIKETVAIESAKNPGYYLRHKNYKFHLQKAINSSFFAKDATFYLLKVQNDPPLYAFELYGHPSWFIMHNKKKHMLMLGHVRGSENEVMDSTFAFKKVRCLQKRRQGQVQKKTVVVGHGSLMEDQSDDDSSDMEHNEEYVNDKNAKTAPAFQTSINEVVMKSGEKDEPNTASVTVATAAFNASRPQQNGRSLDVMEKDIERKVNDLASSLYEQDNKKAFTDETKTADVVIQDNDVDSTSTEPDTQTVDQDVVIKTEESASKSHVLPGRFVHSTQVQKTNKPTQFSKKELKTVSSYKFTKNDKASSNVVKGSPKLVNEHYDIIARASLAIPEGAKDKRQSRMMGSNGEPKADNNNQIINNQNQIKRLQTKIENTKQLFGSLGESVHIVNTSVARTDHQDNHPLHSTSLLNNDSNKLKPNATKPFHRYNPQQRLNGTLATNGRPVVYFSETCQNSLPNVCEVWAQKRYCLTFNELMKRYCRKSCGLCDPIVTTGFSPCDKSCGGGIRLRMIKVNNRQVLQRRACNTHECPINGGYTPFSDFSECSATCGRGLRYKHRTCTQPPPQFGGKDCTRLGSPIKTVECHVAKCEVNNEKKLSKETKESHSLKQANDDYEHMPEYHVEKLSNGGYTVKIDTPKKLNSGIIKHISGNLYQYVDRHGKKKIVRLKGRHGKSFHDHHVYHKGKPVAKLKCGDSKFPKYHRVESNFPPTRSGLDNQNRELEDDDPYKMYEDGKIMYDKYGIPSGTTDEVVKSSASPYKIILHKNKNHELVVREECLESDSSVNPDDGDDENKDFQKPTQGFYGYNFDDPTHSYGSSNLIAQNTLGNEVRQAMGSIGRAIDYDTDAIATSSLMQKEVPKLTLSEELVAENEEALKERRYEENMARKSTDNYAFS
ncbi:uncharacterized protein LOC116302026 isoform X2 [Actinia tenebrosa]|uniref:Uncharacterized protein LOC116302026 isoform X2 n=1 Tax=Actinia tenebrosa TaxID=6105 RepID=A0A6P8IJZ1_ACTTE|nr:uncharacterized protein LOC116302026 isoform X2 [Actinia tenebrosa]